MICRGLKPRCCIFRKSVCRAQTPMWDTAAQPAPTYPQQSLNFLQELMTRYGANPALLAVSLLNEPLVGSSPITPHKTSSASCISGCVMFRASVRHADRPAWVCGAIWAPAGAAPVVLALIDRAHNSPIREAALT